MTSKVKVGLLVACLAGALGVVPNLIPAAEPPPEVRAEHAFDQAQHPWQRTEIPVLQPKQWHIDASWSASTQAAAAGDLLVLEAWRRQRQEAPTLKIGLATGLSWQDLARRALESYEVWERSDQSRLGYDYAATYGAEYCRRSLGLPTAGAFSTMDDVAYDYWMRDPEVSFGVAWGYRLDGHPGSQTSVVQMDVDDVLGYAELYRQLASGFYRERASSDQVERMTRVLGDLKGKAVGDWGCGTGVIMADVAAATGPTGRFIGADLAPSVLRFCQFAADRDPRVKPYVDEGFRMSWMLSRPDHCGFPPASLDVIHTNIHLGADSSDPHQVEHRIRPSLRSLREALREDGVFFVDEHTVPLGVTIALVGAAGFGEPSVYHPDGRPMEGWGQRLDEKQYLAVFPRDADGTKSALW